jgi:hypothetical protein
MMVRKVPSQAVLENKEKRRTDPARTDELLCLALFSRVGQCDQASTVLSLGPLEM